MKATKMMNSHLTHNRNFFITRNISLQLTTLLTYNHHDLYYSTHKPHRSTTLITDNHHNFTRYGSTRSTTPNIHHAKRFHNFIIFLFYLLLFHIKYYINLLMFLVHTLICTSIFLIINTTKYYIYITSLILFTLNYFHFIISNQLLNGFLFNLIQLNSLSVLFYICIIFITSYHFKISCSILFLFLLALCHGRQT